MDDETRDAIARHWKYHPGNTAQRVSGLDGVQLNGMDAAVRIHDASTSWRDARVLAHALATFFAESLLYTRAFHHNVGPDGTVDSTDWGPCQINDKAHPDLFPGGDPDAIACNPDKCFGAAWQIYHAAGGSLDPWYGWKNGVALDDYYLRRASLAVANFVGRDLVTLAKGRAPEIAGRTTPPTTTRVPFISTHDLKLVYP
jgi:hypothetical protein